MKKLFLLFLLLLNLSVSFAETTNLINQPKISKDTYENLLSNLKNQEIKNETIKIETDMFGHIINVETKQEKLKKILLETLLIPFLNPNNELISGNSTLTINKNNINEFMIDDLKKDSITGQLYTAIRVSKLMNEKKYDEAIKLFSKKQNEKISTMKLQNEDAFEYWCSAWTLNKPQLKWYLGRIILGKGIFIFEDGEWKINEN
ncbi:MAG: hypothetical protein AABZ74_08855 [Cyanobacteriota bacterium]